MNGFDSMKKKLEQTGIYNITDSSNTAKELHTYAEGIDTLYSMLAELERECYIPTSESYGLDMRENFTGENRLNLSMEQRRKLLCAAEQHKTECTRAEFEKILSGYGLQSFTITENYAAFALTIGINDSLTQKEKNVIENKISADFPLHLNVNVVYNS